MQYNTGLPDFFAAAFAAAGDKNAIPASTSTAGLAALNTGFPAICSLAEEAGGIAPNREDFNGILYWLSLAVQRLQAGSWMPYNAAFSTAIGGYPKGAMVRNADGSGYWQSTVDNNTSNPDGASPVGWVNASTPPDASTTAKGIVELATPEETVTGTDTVRAVTPAGVKATLPLDASTSVKGIVELATSEETVTGTDTERAVTPAGLKAAINVLNFASSLADSGYQKLPSGLILQWMKTVESASPTNSRSWPIAFPNAALAALAATVTVETSNAEACSITGITVTGIRFFCGDSYNTGDYAYVIAIGY